MNDFWTAFAWGLAFGAGLLTAKAIAWCVAFLCAVFCLLSKRVSENRDKKMWRDLAAERWARYEQNEAAAVQPLSDDAVTKGLKLAASERKTKA